MKFQPGDWFVDKEFSRGYNNLLEIVHFDGLSVNYKYFCKDCQTYHEEAKFITIFEGDYIDLRDVPLLDLLLQIDFEQLKPALPFLRSKRA